MKYVIEEDSQNKWWLGVRFIGIAFITSFLLLALATDLMGVLDTFFGILINPKESLAYVMLAYLAIFNIFTYLADSGGRENPTKPLGIGRIMILLGVPLMLLLMAYEVNHPFPINYLPGELDRRNGVVMGFTILLITIESFGTACYDLKRLLRREANKTQSRIQDEE